MTSISSSATPLIQATSNTWWEDVRLRGPLMGCWAPGGPSICNTTCHLADRMSPAAQQAVMSQHLALLNRV